jgi:hypothetical protein
MMAKQQKAFAKNDFAKAFCCLHKRGRGFEDDIAFCLVFFSQKKLPATAMLVY